MMVVARTPKKATVMVSEDEMNNKGFDNVWDQIRSDFPEREFTLNNIEKDKEDNIFFELKKNDAPKKEIKKKQII